MGEGPRRAPGRTDDAGGLAARLRREARAERPAFSPSLHAGVVAAVARGSRRPSGRAAGRRRWSPAALACIAAACGALVLGVPWPRPPAPPDAVPVAVVADVPGIDRLPTPGEIGDGVIAEVTTLAAAAVGLPAWRALAALDPDALAGIDDGAR